MNNRATVTLSPYTFSCFIPCTNNQYSLAKRYINNSIPHWQTKLPFLHTTTTPVTTTLNHSGNKSMNADSNDSTASNDSNFKMVHLLPLSHMPSLSYHNAVSDSQSRIEKSNAGKVNTVFTSTGVLGSLVARIVPHEYKDYHAKKPSSFLVDVAPFRGVLNSCDGEENQIIDENDAFINNKLTKIINISHISDSEESSNIPQMPSEPFGQPSPSDLCVVLDLDIDLPIPTTQDDTNNDCISNNMIDSQVHSNHIKNTLHPLHVHLNRDGQESAIRSLERLEISTRKKVDKITKKKKEKKMSMKKKFKENEVNNNTIPLLYRESLIGNDYQCIENITTDSLTTIQLIQQLSVTNHINKDVDFGISIASTSNLSEKRIRFISNPPTILSIQTAFENFTQHIYVGVPITIQTILLHATKVVVSWFAGDTLVKHNSLYFTPSSDHIGKVITVYLKPINSKIRNGSYLSCPTDHDSEEAYQFKKVVEPLPHMPIVSPLRDDFNHLRRNFTNGKQESNSKPLRVATYNILADLYVSRDVTINITQSKNEDSLSTTQFPHVPILDHLNKMRRLPMIIAELLSYNADIICLQEVDGGLIYDSFIEPVMNVMGFDGYYSNKASCQREGCALFWSRRMFDVSGSRDKSLKSFGIRDLFEYNNESNEEKWESIKGINDLLRDHDELHKITMEKIGQVVQVAKLRLKESKGWSCNEASSTSKPSHIVVANTHLFYHPLADHIRAMQTYVVCKKIDEIRRQQSQSHPFLLCGDLNSDPLSGAAQLLFTRTLRPDHHDCWKHLHEYTWDCSENDYMAEHGYIGNEVGSTDLICEEEAFDDALEQDTKKESKNSIPMPPLISLPKSFPDLISGCLEMPKFTNYAVDFVDTLDYVLASAPSEEYPFGFSQKASAPMPDVDDVTKFVAMPNECMPSDHVSVVCDLEWSRYERNTNSNDKK